MKKYISIALFFLCLFSICACRESGGETQSTSAETEATGKIIVNKILDTNGYHIYTRTTEYYASGAPKKITEKYVDGIGFKEELFDESGIITYSHRTVQTSTVDGKEYSHIETSYYIDGKESRVEKYDMNGSLLSYTLYLYKENGGKKLEYDASGALTSSLEYENGSDGTSFYITKHPDGKVNEKVISKNNYIIQTTRYYYDIDSMAVEISDYGEKGAAEKISTYLTNKEYSGTLYSLVEYDENGRVKRTTFYKPDGTVSEIYENN